MSSSAASRGRWHDLTPDSAATSYVGERANPHPSQGDKYVVEVIDQAEGEVCVRYVSHTVPPWWITEETWRWWKAHTT